MALVLNGSGITSANLVNGTIVDEDVADVAASKLTGALPAIDGSALTGVSHTTSVVNTAGQNWAGVAYTDPDAVGTNPTAKIYPDGTVVGSTDNGSYTKYPNGDLECWERVLKGANTQSGSIYFNNNSFAFPMTFSGLPIISSSLDGNNASIVSNMWIFIRNINTSNTNFQWISPDNVTATLYIHTHAKGRWK
jgi:hypothetical protein